MKQILFLYLIAYLVSASASEEKHDAHGEEEKEAIELSEQAVKNFEIKVRKIVPVDRKAEIPVSAIVKSEDKSQIFILHEGKYEVREINIVKRTASMVTVDSFAESEDVVISGVNYLKVVEMSHGEEEGGGRHGN